MASLPHPAPKTALRRLPGAVAPPPPALGRAKTMFWSVDSARGDAKPVRGRPNRPLGNVARPLGNDSRPLGNGPRPLGNRSRPLGNDSRPLGNDSRPLGNDSRPLGNGHRAVGNGHRAVGNGHFYGKTDEEGPGRSKIPPFRPIPKAADLPLSRPRRAAGRSLAANLLPPPPATQCQTRGAGRLWNLHFAPSHPADILPGRCAQLSRPVGP